MNARQHALVRDLVTCVALVPLLLLLAPLSRAQAEDLTIARFESSAFYKKYQLVYKSSWPVTDGNAFNYRFKDPRDLDPDRDISIALSPHADRVTRVSIRWHGDSTLAPGILTKSKEAILRDLILATQSGVDVTKIVAYVRIAQVMKYDGGGNVMPRKKFGRISVYAGVVGSTLHVGFEK